MNKQSIFRMMAAVLLMVGLSGGVSFAQTTDAGDVMTATPVPAPKATPVPPVWSGMLQFQGNLSNEGNTQALSIYHARVRGVIPVDSEDTLVIMPDYATGPTGALFTLLDAYGVHQFSDVNGLSAMAGQFKFAFGDNRYLVPQQLKRTAYNMIDSLLPGAATAKAWDLGMEVKEQINAFSIQVDAIQGEGPNAVPGTATDPGNTMDLTTTAQYKTSSFILGASVYSGKGRQTFTGNTKIQDWLDAYGRLTLDPVDFRTEAILAPNNASGMDLQLSMKPISWFEPLIWFETMNGQPTTAGTTSVNAFYNTYHTISNNFGLGVNLWAGAKTRVSMDVSFIGTSDILNANSETLQFEEVF